MFNQYPYLNINDFNLDYIVKSLGELQKAMEEFFAKSEIKYADPIQWDITKQYEINTIVINDNIGYMSIKPVPTGITIDNDEYWLKIFDFGEFLADISKNFSDILQYGNTASRHIDSGRWFLIDYRLAKAIATIEAGNQFNSNNTRYFTLENLWNDFVSKYLDDFEAYKTQIEGEISDFEDSVPDTIDNAIIRLASNLEAQLNAAISGVTVDSEVINARVGANGYTYPTAGDNIRSLDGGFATATGNIILEPTGDHAYINTSITPVSLTPISVAAGWLYWIINCVPGEEYTINASGGASPRLWCFIDSANEIITNARGGTVGNKLVVTAPATATKLIINDISEVGTVFRGKLIVEKVNDNATDINSAGTFNEVAGVFYNDVMNGSGGTATNIGYRLEVNCESETTYAVSGRTFNMNPPSYCLWIVKDASNNIIKYDTASDDNTVYEDVIIRTPANAAKLIVNCYNYTEAKVKRLSNNDYKFAGKKILWLGNSISEGNVTPANGYPDVIENMLHCVVFNNSIGASACRMGNPNYTSIINICGVQNLNGLKNLSQTVAEKDAMINDWQDICTELGIVYTPITPSEKLAYEGMSYENLIVPYLTGPNKVDLIVFNHCFNDNIIGAPIDTEPPTPYDRLYFYGAMNYLIKLIRETAPDIKIMIFGHYQSTFDEVLEKVARDWYLPYCKLWDRIGWANQTINASSRVNAGGNWTSVTPPEDMTIKNQWVFDGTHPKGVANQHIAETSLYYICEVLE